MEKIDDILEPIKAYNNVLNTFKNNVDEYFNNLVKDSKVNIDENQKTCANVYELERKVKVQEKKRTGNKVGKVFAAIFAACGFLAMIFGILFLVGVIGSNSTVLGIVLLVVGLVVGVGLTLVICLLINKNIKKIQANIDKLTNELNIEKDKAFKQMESLNDSFSWGIPQQLISQTTPLIQMDPIFNPYRYYQMIQNYDWDPSHSDDESTLCVQSGEIKGNPFLFERVFYTWMGTFTYVGTLVISWTTHGVDSQGHSTTEHHTQTLTATLTKPKPYYDNVTNLIYGNNAAPDLTFTRKPINIDSNNEKKLARFVKKQSKKLEKKAQKSISNGGSFIKMGNDEFEALFNCQDRDNEQQFRLLFTPIGQSNMINLIKSSPYGDDFTFSKYGKINVIRSAHSQNFDYLSYPWRYEDFDYKTIEKTFKTYCFDYLQSAYFDLAPLLSIPQYQQNEPDDFIFKSRSKNNVTIHEIESLCNLYGQQHFAASNSNTDAILKVQLTGLSNDIDKAIVHAFSYTAIPHTTFVPVMGGDGHMHQVPVHWYEYRPVYKKTNISLLDHEAFMKRFKNQKADINKEIEKLGFHPTYGQKSIWMEIK